VSESVSFFRARAHEYGARILRLRNVHADDAGRERDDGCESDIRVHVCVYAILL